MCFYEFKGLEKNYIAGKIFRDPNIILDLIVKKTVFLTSNETAFDFSAKFGILTAKM